MTEKSEKTEMGMNEWVVYDVSSWNAAVFFSRLKTSIWKMDKEPDTGRWNWLNIVELAEDWGH